jgi:hypothetical protein
MAATIIIKNGNAIYTVKQNDSYFLPSYKKTSILVGFDESYDQTFLVYQWSSTAISFKNPGNNNSFKIKAHTNLADYSGEYAITIFDSRKPNTKIIFKFELEFFSKVDLKCIKQSNPNRDIEISESNILSFPKFSVVHLSVLPTNGSGFFSYDWSFNPKNKSQNLNQSYSLASLRDFENPGDQNSLVFIDSFEEIDGVYTVTVKDLLDSESKITINMHISFYQQIELSIYHMIDNKYEIHATKGNGTPYIYKWLDANNEVVSNNYQLEPNYSGTYIASVYNESDKSTIMTHSIKISVPISGSLKYLSTNKIGSAAEDNINLLSRYNNDNSINHSDRQEYISKAGRTGFIENNSKITLNELSLNKLELIAKGGTLPYKYKWILPDGTITSERMPTVNQNGVYSVELISSEDEMGISDVAIFSTNIRLDDNTCKITIALKINKKSIKSDKSKSIIISDSKIQISANITLENYHKKKINYRLMLIDSYDNVTVLAKDTVKLENGSASLLFDKHKIITFPSYIRFELYSTKNDNEILKVTNYVINKQNNLPLIQMITVNEIFNE